MTLRRLLYLSWLTAFPAVSQTLPVLDQTPGSLRWYRLKTPHFRVLYPEGFEQTARQTAARLEQVYQPVSAALERQPRPISILLQNQTTVSNGFVTLFPRRSEFFTTPPQDPFLAGTLPWLDLLAVHEFRHVVQYDKALQGYGRVLYTLLGSPGLAFSLLTTPDWFLEGDAVGAETILTRSGRGRIPNFDIGFRTNLLAKKPFSYAKAVNGSFRDNVPNHYVLGYFLTTYLKRNQGPNAWSRVLDHYYTRFPIYPFSFSNALRRTTGLRADDLYARTVADVTEVWRQQQQSLTFTDATFFPVRAEKAQTARPVFTNYRYPQWLNDSTIVAVKSGLGDISQLVLLSRTGREQRVFMQGLVNDAEQFSVAAGRAVWVEFRNDPRWGARVYSEIRRLDLTTGRLTRLTRRGRYTTVALSPDGSRLIAVRSDNPTTTGTTLGAQTRLVVLDSETGEELRTLDTSPDEFYQHPRWLPDNQTVVAVALGAAGKTLRLFDTQTGQTRDLLPRTNDNLSNPEPWGDYILYNSPQSGIDNIYAVHRSTGQQAQVTSRPRGAYHAAVAPAGNRLAFHDFAVDGFRIADMPLDAARWRPMPTGAAGEVRYFGPLLRQSGVAAPVPDSLPEPPALVAERFRRLPHALNIYGYGPVVQSGGQGLTVGIASQDLLSTTQVSAGYAYNQSEQAGNFFADLSYQGLFPILDLSVQRGNRQTALYIDSRPPLDSLRSDRWQYTQVTAGMRLPLRLTNSRYAQNASLGAYYGYLGVQNYDLPARPFTEVGRNGAASTLSYTASYSLALLQSRRDVGPRRGLALSAQLRHMPFGGTLTGLQWAVSGSTFLPGVGKHHSIRLRGAYQQQRGLTSTAPGQLYRFQAAVLYPRGAPYIAFDQLRIGGIDYRLPLFDCHLSLTRLLYVQRVKGNIFTDYAYGISRLPLRDNRGQVVSTRTVDGYDWTAGADVTFVFNVLRLRTPLELGVRTIRNVRTGEWLIQPLVLDIGF